MVYKPHTIFMVTDLSKCLKPKANCLHIKPPRAFIYIYMYIYNIYILIKRAALYREQVMSVESTFDFWRFKPIFFLNPCKIHNYLVTPVLITFGSELRKRQPGVTLPKAPTTNYDGVFLEPLPTAEILDNVCARVANFYAVISRLFVK